MTSSTALWGGRFENGLSETASQFNASWQVDKHLWQEDLSGSIAHAKMLTKIGVLSHAECDALITELEVLKAMPLETVETLISDGGEFYEDVHTVVESLLVKKIGDIAKKLHTGRSRNDQVATDFRLYCMKNTIAMQKEIRQLMKVLVMLADQHQMTLMPGYTHLQRAQPVTLGYHLLAYVAMFQRDYQRLMESYYRTSQLPLGSGALAGVPYANDRDYVVDLLGFEGVCVHAMDAVSDRDFALELLANASMVQMHLSRLAEELILWSTSEFGMVKLSDAFTTGSSIMPQKKNPDVAELIRGKTGRVYGNLVSLFTTLKALPMAYNKDLQEDKEPVMDTVNTLLKELPLMSEMLLSATFNTETMAQAVSKGYLCATDLADYFVSCGIPFRVAHEVTGQAVLKAEAMGVGLEDLTLENYHSIALLINQTAHDYSDAWEKAMTESLYIVLDPWHGIHQKKSLGSVHPEAVATMIKTYQDWLKSLFLQDK